ncbi:unnamed protein product [Leptidea sinapis]|uniref:Uncharacterized protein n=1 Tax=Leptidea sinapis TaxID=189913 RepID=A0A5E4PVL3_9NEOP|nr:unnamed protein product [Leptidea sinapis]
MCCSSYKAEKRAGRSRREGRERCEGRDVREAREARGREETGALALAPPADVHHARRYNDMAPKRTYQSSSDSSTTCRVANFPLYFVDVFFEWPLFLPEFDNYKTRAHKTLDRKITAMDSKSPLTELDDDTLKY